MAIEKVERKLIAPICDVCRRRIGGDDVPVMEIVGSDEQMQALSVAIILCNRADCKPGMIHQVQAT